MNAVAFDFSKASFRPASKKQHWQTINGIADRHRNAYARAFRLDMIEMIALINRRKLEERLGLGQPYAVEYLRQLMNERKKLLWRNSFNVFDRISWNTAKATEPLLPFKTVRKRVERPSLEYRFDLVNVYQKPTYMKYKLDLAGQYSTNTLETFKRIIAAAAENGDTPREVANLLLDTGALKVTPRQGDALLRYRDTLEEQGMDYADISEEVNRMADRMLKQRAKTIARSETIRAANMGQQALWQDAIDAGYIDPNEMATVWITTTDDRACPDCWSLNGAIKNINGSFNLMQVNGKPTTTLTPPLHPNCRCSLGLQYVPSGDIPKDATRTAGRTR